MSGRNSGAFPTRRHAGVAEVPASEEPRDQGRPTESLGEWEAMSDPFSTPPRSGNRLWLGPVVWAALLVGVVVTLIVATTDVLHGAERAHLEHDLDSLGLSVVSRLDGNRDYLMLLADDRASGRLTRAEFRARGSQYISDHPELIALNWVDASSVIEDVAPLAGNEHIIGLRLELPEPRRAANLAKEQRSPAYTRPFEAVQGVPAFEIWVPVFRGDELLGWLGGVYSCERLLRHLTPTSLAARSHASLLDDRGRELVELSDSEPYDAATALSRPLDPPGHLALRLALHRPVARLVGLTTLGAALGLLTCGMAYAMWALKREARDRRLMEEASRRAGRMLQAVFDSAATAICAKDKQGRVLLANRRFTELHGLGPEPIVGKTLHELLPKVLADRLRETDRRVLATGAPLEVEEALPLNGAIRVFLTAAAPILDATGQPSGVCCGTTELTQRKALEEQLRRAQKMEVVGQVAGGMAHDFNNLLTAILGSTTFLKDAVPVHSPLFADVEQIERACVRAGRLTRQLLAFARRQVVEPVSVELGERLAELHGMLRRMIGEAIDLVVLPAEGTWPVMIDPGQLEQVIANLTVNARDAMPQGGKLTITTENLTLTAADPALGLSPGDYVVLAVRDTGTGVSPEAREHLFEPFFSTKGRGKGTGLGLATCFGIAQRVGGTIQVENHEEGGACFRVVLPRTSTPPEQRRSAEAPERLPRGTETILLVEDEPLVRGTTRHMLEALGYVVVTAANGGEALRLVQERRDMALDLVVTDVVMPHVGGPELGRRLRETRPTLPIVYMSGYIDDESVCAELGKQGATFLQKPFSRRALAERVREALEGHVRGPE